MCGEVWKRWKNKKKKIVPQCEEVTLFESYIMGENSGRCGELSAMWKDGKVLWKWKLEGNTRIGMEKTCRGELIEWMDM